MEQQLARGELEKEMPTSSPGSRCCASISPADPDDGFSGVPYEKGALFLRRLEQIWGRKTFDAFLRGYFDSHAFQSITTEDFLAYLQRELFARDAKKAAEIDLAQWLDQPGMPADAPRAKSALLDAVDRELRRWQAGTPAKDLDTQGWATQQWQHFIQSLPADLGAQRMVELDQAFGFTQTGNSEILCDWLVVAVRNGYLAADPRLNEFLMNVGRRKYLKPLYTEMAKTDEGMARARAIYAKARPRYHAVSTGTIDKILKWSA
jgi:hypothetical protein